ncbi:MAG: enoyl-CoA hydratase/isomerase family protein [Chloroflexi bacterium]|nr:enoyl-CoA hydratase/isomerase family protein [Chloroflexota bacterium]
MKLEVNKAVVIGAGTMGAAIAAHLANAGIPVTLLDIVPDKLTKEEKKQGLKLKDKAVRNRIVNEGFQRALKSRPASFVSDDSSVLVSLGNLEDDFDAVGQADWVIEAVVENLKIKRALMAKIDQVCKGDAIISTNTSGIPVHSIVAGLTKGFRSHFLGTHFFNPPRYLKLLEIIPTPDTAPEVVAFISHFGEFRLGKGIVLCNDTPNFIGNRIGSVAGAFALDYILEHGYTVSEVDAITGPVIGRPKTATFRLLDLVGIDVANHVRTNLADAIPEDSSAQEVLQSEKANALSQALIEKGWLGRKSGQGFYKTVLGNDTKEYWALNLSTLEHEPPGEKPRFDSIGKAKDLEEPADRLKMMLSGEDRAADLVRALVFHGLSYASQCIPEISDLPDTIDNAARWGFMHAAGPFEIWDNLGVAETAELMRSNGYDPAGWVVEMLDAGHKTFYKYENGSQVAIYKPAKKEYEALKKSTGIIILKALKDSGGVVAQNPSATMIDIGAGVALVEFHTKMNALDADIGLIVDEALTRVASDFEGLVIGNQGENFSVGANLLFVVMTSQNEAWDQLDQAIRGLQDLHMRMRYFPKPVVVATAGMVLGGGAEMSMHASRVVAAMESYIGLVEVGAGVIPAGGGTKEMLRRVLNPPMRTKNAIDFPFLQRLFEQIGQAKVATSAEEARQMAMLSPIDRVVMNRDHLLSAAKAEVLEMAAKGYSPPLPEKIYAAGRDTLSGLRVGVFMYREGDYISDHDRLVGEKLAYVLTGGELSRAAWVDEQYILDLEREAFLSLCGEKLTQDRMWHLLQTGRPLRN